MRQILYPLRLLDSAPLTGLPNQASYSSTGLPWLRMTARKIVHIDMDAFYASLSRG